MSPMRLIRTLGLACLLALVVPGASEAVEASASHERIQARIAETVKAIGDADRGGDGDRIPAMADELVRLTDGDRESLLVELVKFLAGHPGHESSMGAALLIDYYGFTDQEKVEALTPHIGTDDARMRDLIWEVLGTVDRPQGAHEAVQRVQRLEQLLSRLDHADSGESGSAREEIDRLSRDEIWWIRLYAALAIRSHPDLDGETVERLRSDPDSRVRQAAGG
jgi:hypothetical protein